MLSKYQFLEPLGSGSFGDVFKAVSLKEKCQVAIKVEQLEADCKSALAREAKIFGRLSEVKGVPKMLEYFTHVDRAYLVLELLGAPVLLDLRQRTYPVPRAASIILRTLKVLRRIHSRGVLHRDIKPQNILYGLGHARHDLYLIDFNLSSTFSSDDPHTQRRQSCFIGTRLFSSANAFVGNEQSRRDDLESLCIVLVWLLKQELPWCHLNGDDYQIMEAKKLTASVTDITLGCPKEVSEMLSHVRSLRFEDSPDYSYIASLLRQMRRRYKAELVDPERLSLTENSDEDEPSTPVTDTEKHRRKSVSAHNTSADAVTPKLRPPEVSKILRARIKQIHEGGAIVLPKTSC